MKSLLIETQSGDASAYDRRKSFSENVRRELRVSRVTGRKRLSLALKKVRALAKRLRAFRAVKQLPVVREGDALLEEDLPPSRHLGLPDRPMNRNFDAQSLAMITRRPRQVFLRKYISLVPDCTTVTRWGTLTLHVVWRVKYSTYVERQVAPTILFPRKFVKSKFFGFSQWCTHEDSKLRCQLAPLDSSSPWDSPKLRFCPAEAKEREITRGWLGDVSAIRYWTVSCHRAPRSVPSLVEWAKVNPFLAMHRESINRYYCARCLSVFSGAGDMIKVGGCTMHKDNCDKACLRKQWKRQDSEDRL